MSTSHYGNINILVIVGHLTSWSMLKAIPDKETSMVANAIFDKLIIEHGSPEIFLFDNGKEFSNDTLGYVWQDILLPLTLQDLMARQTLLTSFSVCQENEASWDQVLDQIPLSYGCCSHTCTC